MNMSANPIQNTIKTASIIDVTERKFCSLFEVFSPWLASIFREQFGANLAPEFPTFGLRVSCFARFNVQESRPNVSNTPVLLTHKTLQTDLRSFLQAIGLGPFLLGNL